MKLIKNFAFGAMYLISGVYSIGFALLMDLGARSVSGNPATVVTPDTLFPFEVAVFILFGFCFMAAAAYQFSHTLKQAS